MDSISECQCQTLQGSYWRVWPHTFPDVIKKV